MDADQFHCLSNNESNTENNEGSAVPNNVPPPPYTRIYCSDCTKTFVSESQLIYHQNKSYFRDLTKPQHFMLAKNREPSPPPIPLVLPTMIQENIPIIPIYGLDNNNNNNNNNNDNHRYHPYMRPREHQFFPTSPGVGGGNSLERTLDLVSLIDNRPGGSVPNHQVPEPSGRAFSANESVAGWGALIGLDIVKLDLELDLDLKL